MYLQIESVAAAEKISSSSNSGLGVGLGRSTSTSSPHGVFLPHRRATAAKIPVPSRLPGGAAAAAALAAHGADHHDTVACTPEEIYCYTQYNSSSLSALHNYNTARFPPSYYSYDQMSSINNHDARTFASSTMDQNGPGRPDRLDQVMSLHPQYLKIYNKSQAFVMRGDGPLPYHYRNYIAIMAAGRHQCSYLIEQQVSEFLQQGGDESWLQGLHRIPAKLRDLYEVNQILAHRPWLITKHHIEKLTKGSDNWSLGELVHALVILSHFHAVSSFVFGCGIGDGEEEPPCLNPVSVAPEIPGSINDHHQSNGSSGINAGGVSSSSQQQSLMMDAYIPSPAPGRHQVRTEEEDGSAIIQLPSSSSEPSEPFGPMNSILDQRAYINVNSGSRTGSGRGSPEAFNLNSKDLISSESSNGFGGGSGGPSSRRSTMGADGGGVGGDCPAEVSLDTLMRRMKSLAERRQEFSAEEQTKRYERVESQSAELGVACSAPSATRPKAEISQFIQDPDFVYQDFARRGEVNAIPTFRVQDYSWDDHAYSLINRLYCDVGNLLDDKFRLMYQLTYNTMGGKKDVDTSRFRTAIWNYIQCMFGIRHDDYDYGEVNQVLERSLKTYIKKTVCFPERVTRADYDSVLKEFHHSEKIHVNLMLLEARIQAELLYALRAIMRHMT